MIETIINVLLWPITVPVEFVVRLAMGKPDDDLAASLSGFVTLMISIPVAVAVYVSLAVWLLIYCLK